MTNQSETVKGGKKETLYEVLVKRGYLKPETPVTQDQFLVAILTRTQRMCAGFYTLMTEHWDWLVVLQCMQDHHLFKENPKRPPFTAFEQWLEQNKVPQLLAHCSERNLRYVNKKIRGARYPWKDVAWEPHVLKRWRVLYRTLDKMLIELQDTSGVVK